MNCHGTLDSELSLDQGTCRWIPLPLDSGLHLDNAGYFPGLRPVDCSCQCLWNHLYSRKKPQPWFMIWTDLVCVSFFLFHSGLSAWNAQSCPAYRDCFLFAWSRPRRMMHHMQGQKCTVRSSSCAPPTLDLPLARIVDCPVVFSLGPAVFYSSDRHWPLHPRVIHARDFSSFSRLLFRISASSAVRFAILTGFA
ncbi:hypothetical protein VTI74DRAFT_1039 [Chaetomium olivicolor]